MDQLNGHWSAWFSDAPESAYGGEWPADAIRALLWAHPERGVIPEQITSDDDALRDGHLEFLLSTSLPPCPDCGGSGRYVGLNSVDVCRACHGSGRRCEIPY